MAPRDAARSPRSSSAFESGGLHRTDSRRLTAFDAGMTVLKCNWGIGMMGMPHMLDKGGLAAGLTVFVACMLLAQLTIHRTLEVKDALRAAPAVGGAGGVDKEGAAEGGAAEGDDEDEDVVEVAAETESSGLKAAPPARIGGDYTGLIAASLGPAAEWVAIITLLLNQWGSGVAFLKFIGDNMHKFAGGLPRGGWVGVVLVPALALVSFDDLRPLARFSVAGLCCGVGFAALFIADAGIALSPGDFDSYLRNASQLHWKNLPLALSMCVFCNEGIIVLTPSTHDAMRRPELYTTVTAAAIAVFTAFYMAVAVAGCAHYSATPDGVKDEAALNLDEGVARDRVAAVLYCAQLLPTLAVAYFCAYEAWELQWLRRARAGDRGGGEFLRLRPRFVAVRWLTLGVAAGVSVTVPHFGAFLGLIGAMGTAVGVYVLPHWAWIAVVARPQALPLRRTLPSYLCAGFGCVLAVTGTVQSAWQLFT